MTFSVSSADNDPGVPVLQVEDLRKSYGEIQAVRGVSFEIAAGENYGLLGPNGAGKTTTIQMIAGVLTAAGGRVTVCGQELTTSTTSVKSHMGWVPQEIALYDRLSARENLAFFGRMQGLSGRALAKRVDEVLGLTALGDRADEKTVKFSGGMRRRLNIGIGLLHQPDLLILDEPTVGVDIQSRAGILDQVAEMTRQGMAVLYTTHYIEEVERLCHRVGIIDHGQLIAEGTRAELVKTVGERTRVLISADGNLSEGADRLSELDGVHQAGITKEGIDLLVDDATPLLPRVLETLTGSGVAVGGVRVEEPDLEAVFLHLTGRALRD
ncbi:MAG: ABC transporter ATP-binding protein [Acidimicrobiia bacterium]|nr:ABC transporter ATP-binding protein [Acidimicrobiia bacterium]